MKKGITKENFWDELSKSCPEAVNEFFRWLEVFKKSTQWDRIFQPEVTFDNLPFSLQKGILELFSKEIQEAFILITSCYPDETSLARIKQHFRSRQFEKFKHLEGYVKETPEDDECKVNN